jgi:hypothetical protein
MRLVSVNGIRNPSTTSSARESDGMDLSSRESNSGPRLSHDGSGYADPVKSKSWQERGSVSSEIRDSGHHHDWDPNLGLSGELTSTALSSPRSTEAGRSKSESIEEHEHGCC